MLRTSASRKAFPLHSTRALLEDRNTNLPELGEAALHHRIVYRLTVSTEATECQACVMV